MFNSYSYTESTMRVGSSQGQGRLNPLQSPVCPTCLKSWSVSVQYRLCCSPPCSSTTAPLGAPAAPRAWLSRRRFSANSLADTLRVSFPSQKVGLPGKRHTGITWEG